jgi:Flp pilus assembly protein TadD
MTVPSATRHHTSPLPPQATAAIASGRRALDSGRFDDAVKSFRKAVTLAPRQSALHYALGMACIKANRAAEAIAPMQCARDLVSDNYEFQLGLADAFFLAGQPAHALPEYLRAGAIRPTAVVPWSNAGALYRELGRPELALEALHRALTIDPSHASALCNSALAFHDLGEFAIARDSVELALQSRPDYAEAHWNRAILDLLHGNFVRGWAGHEYRTVQLAKLGGLRTFPEERWDGAPFVGRRLLLWPEQGLGDQLQFVRFLPRVKALGGTVVLVCAAPLVQLFRENCPDADEVVALGTSDSIERVDFQLPLLSLPHVLKLHEQLDTARVPYVQAVGDSCETLNQVLPARDTSSTQPLRVGVCWAGQPKHVNDHNRSLTLGALAPLMHVPGIEWYALQKGDAAEAQLEPFNMRAAEDGHNVITPLGHALSNFADTAHAISRLDVVLSVDTSVAHLAGAMNVPTFMLIPFVPDWRWQLDRDDSPWYPAAQLFRQTSPGDWVPVITRVANALRKLTAARGLSKTDMDASNTPSRAA